MSKINKMITDMIKNHNKKEGFTTIFQTEIPYNMQDCFWCKNNTKIATIEDKSYRIDTKVYGELRYEIIDKEENSLGVYTDASHILQYGIQNDVDLHKLMNGENENYDINIIDNNWIEMPIYNKCQEQYITDEYDATCIIPDTNNILEAIDGGILDYIDGFLYKDNELEY